MAFKTVTDLSADVTISLGGFNKKTKKDNPLTVEGYYLGNRQVEDKKKKDGKSYIYFFQTAKGNVGVWGKTDLDRKMKSVALGTMTRASFDKMVPTPNGEMYKYKVEVDTENTIEVDGGLSASDTDSSTGPSFDETEELDGDYQTEDDDSGDAEEAAQQAALAAAERAAKVKALLGNKGKTK